MPGFFITATGTDIGKTFVTAGLIRALRARGSHVTALKPVVSGFEEAALEGSDPALLLEALGRSLNASELNIISPWRFKAPLSPDMAARKEGRCIDFDEVTAYCQNVIAGNAGLTLIEGVGGLMVPLNERFTTLDLMRQLALSPILISGSYLGAISHLLTALNVLKRYDLSPRAIVINESEGSSVSMQDTLETVAHFCGEVPLFPIARQTTGTPPDSTFAHLADALAHP